MRRLVVLAVLLAACAAPRAAFAPTLTPDSPGPVVGAVKRTVYLRKSGCTGVLMGNGRMVTAKHCAPDDATVGAAYEGGKLHYISPTYDFVVVDFPNRGRAVKLHKAPMGEHVWVVGYPVQLGSGEQELTVTDGVVAGPVDSEGQARITAPVYFGNSGGGVWSDRGELVGIAVAIYAAHLDLGRPVPYVAQSFMVPVELIRPYL